MRPGMEPRPLRVSDGRQRVRLTTFSVIAAIICSTGASPASAVGVNRSGEVLPGGAASSDQLDHSTGPCVAPTLDHLALGLSG